MNAVVVQGRRVLADITVLVAAFFAAVLLRFEFTLPQQALSHLVWWLPVVVGLNLAVLMLMWGHRHPWRYTDLGETLVVAEAMAASALLLLALWYAAPHVPLLREPVRLQGLSRAVILLQAALGFLGLTATRLLRRLLHEQRRRRTRERRGLRRRQVVLLGAGRTGRTVACELAEHPELMLEPIGFVDDQPNMQGQFICGLPVLGTVDDLEEVCARYQPDSALLTWDDPTGDSRRCVREAAEQILPVRTVPALTHLLSGRVPARNPDPDPPGGATGRLEAAPPRVPAAKRAVDVVLGSLLAAAATPVIVLLATVAGIRLRAWPLFLQDRIGLGGRHFRFPKIRTMPPDAPSYELLPDEAELPGSCRWMRRHHLDELPQLYLVPFGPMSLVGPRPKMPDDAEPVEEHYRTVRSLVPQGCTCLWQIGVHTDGLPSDSPEYDFWYLTHGSVRMDLWILYRTVLQMLGAGRCHALEDIPDWTKGRGWVDAELVFGTPSAEMIPEPAPSAARE